MHIINQKTTQILILQYNQIPFIKLLSKKNIDALGAKLKFSEAAPIQNANGDLVAFGFRMGMLTTEDNKELSIVQCVIEERKIVLAVEGSSSDASTLFGEIRNFLADIAETSEEDFLNPIICANESEMVVHLDLATNRLFSTELFDFVHEDVLSEASSQYEQLPETTIESISVKFQVSYRTKDNSLSERRIALNRKDFLLESATGYPVSEQVYLSKAPVDTETHIQLLKKLVATLA